MINDVTFYLSCVILCHSDLATDLAAFLPQYQLSLGPGWGDATDINLLS